MAQLSGHRVAPVPRAPEREATGHLLLRAYATFVLFSAMAYSWWYNLLGPVGSVVVLGGATLATAAIWIPHLARRRGRRAFAWRRLPWSALAWGALTLVSVAWSAWPGATLTTWPVLVAMTLQGLFIADMLTWGEIVRALEVALRWVLGATVVFEAWVALVVRHPILPNFFPVDGDPDPHWYWVRGNLFDAALVGPRIQGIVGNANLLGMLCVVALIVFAARLAVAVADSAPGQTIAVHVFWIALALWLLIRSGSATSFIALAVAGGVALVALLMRRQRTPGGRTRIYAVFSALAAAGAALVWIGWERILAVLGRGEGLTGRDDIWSAVLDRAAERPWFGWGYSSPWVPWDEAFDGWIVDHGITVFQAHDMWLDALLQLGAVGVVVLAAAYGSLLWRAWFFAVDRPQWDAHENRPYSPLTLVPILLVWALLAQGVTESNPMMLWGWMLVVLLTFKIKTSPVLTHPDADAEIGTRRARRGVVRTAAPAVPRPE